MSEGQTTPHGGVPVTPDPQHDPFDRMLEAAGSYGFDLDRSLLVLALCATLFTAGVVVRCIHSHGKGLPPLRLFAIAVPTFFLTSPLQAWVLTTNWGDSRVTPFDWLAEMLREGGSLQTVMFAFGVVMMIGYMVEPIFTRVSALAHKGVARSTSPG